MENRPVDGKVKGIRIINLACAPFSSVLRRKPTLL